MVIIDWLRRRLYDDAFGEARSLTIALALTWTTRLLALDQRVIVSRSMQPTLDVGDRVLVDKASILIRKLAGRPASLGLRRNDIVVFKPPETCRSIFAELLGGEAPPVADGVGRLSRWKEVLEKRYRRERSPLNESLDFTKRVVAVAGDRVSVRGGLLYVNEKKAAQPLPDVSSVAECLTKKAPQSGRDTGSFKCYFRASYSMGLTVVPQRHVMVLGDYRDLSFDSHVWGPLPVRNVVGHVRARCWPLGRLAWFRRDPPS